MDNIPPANPIPTQEYKAWFKKAVKRQRKGKNPVTPMPNVPFGMGDTGVDGQQAPIQAAPNWDQLWPFESIGTNVTRDLSDVPPALKKSERQWIKKNVTDMTGLVFYERLGMGTFGIVWRTRVTKENMRLELACKIMRMSSKDYDDIEGIDDPVKQQEDLVTAMNKMLQDYRVLRDLKHDKIISFEGLISIPDFRTSFPWATILLFTELCHGTLRSIFVHYPNEMLDERQTRHWFKHIADAVSHLHQHKITHCDINPMNIYFKNKSPVNPSWAGDIFQKTFKLGDLGLAICYPDFPGQETTMAVSRGTRSYMPPEMTFRNFVDVVDTAKGDVYSLGLTLAQSLIGTTEFYESSLTINQKMQDVVDRKGKYNVSTAVAKLIVEMTNPNPIGRINIETALNHYWVNSDVEPHQKTEDQDTEIESPKRKKAKFN